ANRHATPFPESSFLDSLLGQGCLVLAQGDARRVDPVTFGGIHDESAPPAADVQQSLSWLETELAANQIQLRLLRNVERIVRRAEIGARIDHSPVELELVN